MLRSYLKVALRNLRKEKTYAFINILGLAVGIACCILLFVFVQYEWSHDTFHEKRDRLFRVIAQEINPRGETNYVALQPFKIVKPLKDDHAAIIRCAGYMSSSGWVTAGAAGPFMQKFGLVSPDFLEMFTFPLRAGDEASALADKYSIVISEQVAEKLFPGSSQNYASVLGKMIAVGEGEHTQQFTLTGVMESIPKNSSMQFDILVALEQDSYNLFSYSSDNGARLSIYVELTSGSHAEELQGVLAVFTRRYLADRIANLKGQSRIRDSEDAFQLRLQPLSDIHLNSEVSSVYEHTSNGFYSNILFAIGLGVLFIACINFMTLSVSRSTARAVEVGVRKVLGGRRSQLMRQFWCEAMLITLIALGLGICLAELFMPTFNGLIQMDLQIAYFGNWSTGLIFLAIVLGVGFVAGCYPALVVSGFNPVSALKADVRLGGSRPLIKGMVVLQYTLSIGLIISTVIMARQLNFMRTTDTGFNRDFVIHVSNDSPDPETTYERYKQKISENPNIIGVAAGDRSFTNGYNNMGHLDEAGTFSWVRHLRVDYNYLELLEIQLIAGRNFSPEFASDPDEAIIVNESLVKAFGWQKPLGKTLGGSSVGRMARPIVIGVVKDFHIDSMHKPIVPTLLNIHPNYYILGSIFVKIQPHNVKGTLDYLRAAWNVICPEKSFDYAFLDENLKRQYENEERWTTTISYAACFTILISCLGLLGLSALAVARRTKEIGIRKTLGASVMNLTALLSRQFVLLLVVANLLAWPFGYYAMNQWLQNFAYCIEIGWWVFVMAGGIVLLIALFTVGVQTVKAALANPVEALRYE